VDNQVVAPILQTGGQRVDRFTIQLDDGNGHVSTEIIGITLHAAAVI